MLFLQRNDLQGVRVYSAVDLQGLYTLGTVVIDYRGYRVTAQSIIPGILEREQEQSVVYGSIDFGKTVISHPKYLELASNREMCVHSVVLTCKDISYLNSTYSYCYIYWKDSNNSFLKFSIHSTYSHSLT